MRAPRLRSDCPLTRDLRASRSQGPPVGLWRFCDCPKKDCPFTWDLRAFHVRIARLLDPLSSETALSLGAYALGGKQAPSPTINSPSAKVCVMRKTTSSRALEASAFARRRTALSPGTYAPSIRPSFQTCYINLYPQTTQTTIAQIDTQKHNLRMPG